MTSFDFVHTKDIERERETDFSAVLQSYNFYSFIFKISSGIKTEWKTKPVKKVNII